MAEANFFEVWERESPETMKAFFNLADTIQNKSGLDEKTFQLVYLAIQAGRGALGSVTAHAGLAKKAGATREEVRGAIVTTQMTVGVNGVAACRVRGLEDYDKA